MNKEILIVGLGNPGPKYANSRHNLGFMVLDKLAKELLPLDKTKWKLDGKANALVLQATQGVILAKPQTFMNASGFAVKSLTTNHQPASLQGGPPTTNLWVIHDDVDLPLGKLKIRFGGASAGHHGVESIIKEMGTDKFLRFRMGIGKPNKSEKLYSEGIPQKGHVKSEKSVENYVLNNFGEGETGEVKNMIKKAAEAIKVALKDGSEKAMNRFN